MSGATERYPSRAGTTPYQQRGPGTWRCPCHRTDTMPTSEFAACQLTHRWPHAEIDSDHPGVSRHMCCRGGPLRPPASTVRLGPMRGRALNTRFADRPPTYRWPHAEVDSDHPAPLLAFLAICAVGADLCVRPHLQLDWDRCADVRQTPDSPTVSQGTVGARYISPADRDRRKCTGCSFTSMAANCTILFPCPQKLNRRIRRNSPGAN
jgi:hypothetical protein